MEESKDLMKVRLITFDAVSKFKSVNRAFRRGHISIYGAIYPNRPFNNRTLKKGSREINNTKRKIYEQLREVRQAV